MPNITSTIKFISTEVIYWEMMILYKIIVILIIIEPNIGFNIVEKKSIFRYMFFLIKRILRSKIIKGNIISPINKENIPKFVCFIKIITSVIWRIREINAFNTGIL